MQVAKRKLQQHTQSQIHIPHTQSNKHTKSWSLSISIDGPLILMIKILMIDLDLDWFGSSMVSLVNQLVWSIKEGVRLKS
ncbi:unnamed protein product [Ambrosiozyma monospora]|uniref:Unnamed protein product n=1 Tax=Ambrosiozyma monospora TaxID=43982 RepID=A0A9W6Z8B4_AMBMO|nr:unnamed protein product [Ambrosiozyma monospora]